MRRRSAPVEHTPRRAAARERASALALVDTIEVWLVRAGTPPPSGAAGRPSLVELPSGPVPESVLESVLDEGERSRAAAMAADARRQFLVAHAAMRIIVGRHLGAPPGALRWVPGPSGKPALAGAWTGLEANLSHSGDLVALAVSRRRPVGVDVQEVAGRIDPVALAGRYFPRREAGAVAGAGAPAARAEHFARLWARKEACVKAAGGKLGQGLRLTVTRSGRLDARSPRWLGVPVRDPTGRLPGRYRVRDLPVPHGFHAAVALAGGAPFAVVSRWWPGIPEALRPDTPGR